MRTISALLLAAAALTAQIPDFVHGEECLFCHRRDVGPSWQRNAHNGTTRQVEGGDQVLLGSDGARRLKKTGYNKLAFIDGKSTTDFNRQCARCHTTAVDPADFTYSYLGIDCYACHGAVDLNHSTRAATVPFGKRASMTPQQANAVCNACHVRGDNGDVHVRHADGSCLACHALHGNSTAKHRRVLSSAICNDCHFEGQPRKEVRPYDRRHATCETR